MKTSVSYVLRLLVVVLDFCYHPLALLLSTRYNTCIRFNHDEIYVATDLETPG